FGVLRKELALIMLATLMHTPHLGTVMTPHQMYVFALIVMFYVPCVSTIAALRREFGNRRAALVSAGEIALALLLGALVNWGWNLMSLIR
ncbi:MAG: ferrous iron transport protein B, partial [Caldiserica bacterium]|nr:ferrous iron transport protein B [Caldisericota bacterium]